VIYIIKDLKYMWRKSNQVGVGEAMSLSTAIDI